MSEKRNRRDTGIVGPVAASYAGVPISNMGMVSEDRETRCADCGELKADPDEFADGLICTECVEKRDA